MNTLVAKCERIEAAFRAIRVELLSLPQTHEVIALLQQNERDIGAAVERAKIARNVRQQEKAGSN